MVPLSFDSPVASTCGASNDQREVFVPQVSSFEMATGGGGRRCKKWQTLAGVLLVSFLAISALYLSLHGHTNVAQGGDSKESSAVEVGKGSIFFDWKPLDNLCSSPGEADEMVKTVGKRLLLC